MHKFFDLHLEVIYIYAESGGGNYLANALFFFNYYLLNDMITKIKIHKI
jgi:hypothetical protein